MSLTEALLIASSLWTSPSPPPPVPVRRECGEVVILGGGADRVLLQVERGFSWERGMVEVVHFELHAGSGAEPLFEARRRLIDELRAGEKVCVRGQVISRHHRVPALIPDEIESAGQTVSRSSP